MKRFFDTMKYNRAWFRDLAPVEKCAWDYVTASCDNVGVWVPDFRGAEFSIGSAVDWEALPGKVHGNIKILENGKWWLVDFVSFQYGTLIENNRVHISYANLLRKHGLWEIYESMKNGDFKGLESPMDTAKIIQYSYINTITNVKSKKESKTDRTKLPRYGIAEPVYLSDDEMAKLRAKYDKIYIDQYVKKISLWEPKDGKRPKNDYMTILRWLDRDKIPMIQPKPKCSDCGSVLVDGVCHNPDCVRYK